MRPFFVYGTLLPEQPNFLLWKDAIEQITPATLTDFTLFSLERFPMMVARTGERVQGALIEISAEAYPDILATIDQLEGFNPADPANSIYQRKAVEVHTTDGRDITAWTYVGDEKYTGGRLAIGGDWLAFFEGTVGGSAENRPATEQWWQQNRHEASHFSTIMK